jgi:hypothetical protein
MFSLNSYSAYKEYQWYLFEQKKIYDRKKKPKKLLK